jgi:hypothetical protein
MKSKRKLISLANLFPHGNALQDHPHVPCAVPSESDVEIDAVLICKVVRSDSEEDMPVVDEEWFWVIDF